MDSETMTEIQALFVKTMRVNMDCTYSRIAELYVMMWPEKSIKWGGDYGRELVGLSCLFLGEDFDEDTEQLTFTRPIMLKRPISTKDLETTGVNVAEDRIVSIAITRINLDLTCETIYSLVNPGIPIPAEATAVHGITDKMVADAPTFAQLLPNVLGAIEGTDILTFNGLKFDEPLFFNECKRAGHDWDYSKHSFPDAFQVFQHFHPRNLSAAVKEYTGEEMKDAHNAAADTEATAKVFLAQLREHQELPLDMHDLQMFLNKNLPMADLSGKFYYDNKGRACFKFGKHKGRPIMEVNAEEPTYIPWILSSDFPSDSKNFLSALLNTTNQ